jgi:hypothetical protein
MDIDQQRCTKFLDAKRSSSLQLNIQNAPHQLSTGHTAVGLFPDSMNRPQRDLAVNAAAKRLNGLST